MIFISDVHHGLDSLENLPSGKGPLVILGDLINWIDYRNGDGIAKDVFGEESVTKLVELRKKHDFRRYNANGHGRRNQRIHVSKLIVDKLFQNI